VVRRLAALEQGLAVVAVARADGTVHASVVNAGVLEREPAPPSIAFVARGSARKLAHLQRQGHATVVFRRGWEWVAVEGPVQIVGPAGGLDGETGPAGGLQGRPGPAGGLHGRPGPAGGLQGRPGPDDEADLPALLRAIFTAAGGTHDDWPTFDRVMADEGRVAVLVAPQRFTSNG